MTLRRTLAAALLLVALTPAAARADTLLIPWFGVNFGGDAGKDFSESLDAKQFTYGFNFTWMGGGVFGFEFETGYTPDFFGKTDVGGSAALTLTGNIVLGVPFGGQQGFGIRPYGTFGLGVLQSRTDFGATNDLDENNFAWNFGGGAMMFFSQHIGIRADIRYIRAFDDLDISDLEEVIDIGDIERPGKLDFTRFTTGLILRF
jgi:opacity protein-like surface antigen